VRLAKLGLRAALAVPAVPRLRVGAPGWALHMTDRSRSPTARAKAVDASGSASANTSLRVPDLAQAREAAIQAVLLACQLTVEVQARLVSEDVTAKKDRSPVTIADFGAQAIISHELSKAFSHIPLVGEESAGALERIPELAAKVIASARQVNPDFTDDEVIACIKRGSHPGGMGLFWVLDPIDGTKGFLRRDQYAVCLGLVHDGQVLVAVLGCPNLPTDPAAPDGERGCLFVAVDGQGAFQRSIRTGVERPISVSQVHNTSEAEFTESLEAGHKDESRQGLLASSLGITRPPIRMDSQCKFGVVARGQAALYLRLSEKGYDQNIWDIAAGAKIVEEAGGTVTDAQGRPLDYTYGRTIGVGDLFASNGHLHREVLEALRAQVQAGVAQRQAVPKT